jgi:hypothetical protein
MGINYVENDNGVRRIRWFGLAVFLAVCVSMGVLPYVLIRLFAPETPNAAGFLFTCVGSTLFLFVVALTMSLRRPVETLPRSKDG